MRIALGIIVLVLASWFFSALIGTPEETASAQTPAEWVSSEQCRECHSLMPTPAVSSAQQHLPRYLLADSAVSNMHR